MLEELMPVIKPHKRSATVTTEPERVNTLPGVESRISFGPLLHYLKEKRTAVSDIRGGFYNYLIEKFEVEPGLSGVVEDPSVLESQQGLRVLRSELVADEAVGHTLICNHVFAVELYKGHHADGHITDTYKGMDAFLEFMNECRRQYNQHVNWTLHG